MSVITPLFATLTKNTVVGSPPSCKSTPIRVPDQMRSWLTRFSVYLNLLSRSPSNIFVPHLPVSFFRLGHSHKLVCATVVKQEPAAQLHQALDKHHVWNLPDFLPFFFRREYRLIRSRD